MDDVLQYLKNNLDKAEFYAQQWDELLASYPQLISMSSQEEWNKFRKDHPGLELADALWEYGPASANKEIQDLLTQKEPVQDKELEKKDKDKEGPYAIPHQEGKRLSGTLLITNDQEKPITLANATIVIVDAKTKKEIATIRSDSKGYFHSSLLPLSRYILMISHPSIPEGRKRVLNLRATQPPLSLVFRPVLLPKTPLNPSNATQLASAEEPTPQQSTRPTTEIIGSQGKSMSQDKNMISYFENDPSGPQVNLSALSTSLENFTPIIPLSQEIAYDPIYQATREEQVKRWQADAGQEITSSQGQNYLFGDPKDPTAPTLNQDINALLISRHPGLIKKYQDIERQKIYYDHAGKPNPLADPVFKQVEKAIEEARAKALQKARANPSANLHQISLEAAIPYYRLFLEQFPQKAAAYQGVDRGLGAVSSLFKRADALEGKPPTYEGSSSSIIVQRLRPAPLSLSSAADDDLMKDVDDQDDYTAEDDYDNQSEDDEDSNNNYADNEAQEDQAGGYSAENQTRKKQNPLNTLRTANKVLSGISRVASGVSTAFSATSAVVGAIAAGGWAVIIILFILLLIAGIFFIFFKNDTGSVTLIKTSTKTAVANGENIAYNLVVSYTDGVKTIRVTDKIPDNTEYVSAEGPGATYNPTSRTVTWTLSASGPLTSAPSAVCGGMGNPMEDPWPKINRWNDKILLAIDREIRTEGYAVPPNLVKAIMYHESGGDELDKNDWGYTGLMQVGDGSAYGGGSNCDWNKSEYNIYTTQGNLNCGVQHLGRGLETCGRENYTNVIGQYFTGGCDYGSAGPDGFGTTPNAYVNAVIGTYNYLNTLTPAGSCGE